MKNEDSKWYTNDHCHGSVVPVIIVKHDSDCIAAAAADDDDED